MHPAKPLFASAQPCRPWALWLALLLAVFAALAPAVSHALNWARGGQPGMVQVCTSAGPRWMVLGQVQDNTNLADTPANSPAATDGPAHGQIFDHCPFCLLQADRSAPPPQQWSATFAVPGRAVAPAKSQTSFFPTFTAPAPPSRAPPAPV
ncbi:MAG: DUF2946 family protein [Rhodoferax sp.]|nr:DUF2946 family protein [Rhodoferax sp.]